MDRLSQPFFEIAHALQACDARGVDRERCRCCRFGWDESPDDSGVRFLDALLQVCVSPRPPACPETQDPTYEDDIDEARLIAN